MWRKAVINQSQLMMMAQPRRTWVMLRRVREYYCEHNCSWWILAVSPVFVQHFRPLRVRVQLIGHARNNM